MNETPKVDVKIRIAAAMQRWCGHWRAADKRVAQLIGSEPRTVKDYRRGVCAPSLDRAIDLAAVSDEVEAAIYQAIAERRAEIACLRYRLEKEINEQENAPELGLALPPRKRAAC
jgi:hypothetical protein